MVTHPVIGAISNMLWSFNSSSQGYIESVPQLQVCLMSSINALSLLCAGLQMHQITLPQFL